MGPHEEMQKAITRRTFLGRSAAGIGGLALASLLNGGLTAAGTHFAPRARRVIFLFMFGGPSHVDLFDPKPRLRQLHGEELPASVRGGQRLSANTATQEGLRLAASPFRFDRPGKAGADVSELLPHTAKVVD